MKKALVAPVLIALISISLLVAQFACDEEDVGIPCKMLTGGGTGTDGGTSETEPQIDAKGMDCRSRLCLYIAGNADAKPQCTKICDDDSDCPGPNEVSTCSGGFSCQALIVTGGLKCCKMCVCTKFVPSYQRPKVCESFTPNCPNI
jgi:hypothetical protein